MNSYYKNYKNFKYQRRTQFRGSSFEVIFHHRAYIVQASLGRAFDETSHLVLDTVHSHLFFYIDPKVCFQL